MWQHAHVVEVYVIYIVMYTIHLIVCVQAGFKRDQYRSPT